jgi:hypothetical protein
MVRSIRFWCLAFKLIKPKNEGKKFGGPMKPTIFAKRLLGGDGWDPYLEDPASLWLLHWQLFTPPILVPAWAMAINLTGILSFGMTDLKNHFLEYKELILAIQRLSDSSFEKDASCFLRIYGPPSTGISEEIECPFCHLGLLETGDRKSTYQFNTSDKSRLPDWILLAACLDYARNYHPSANSVSVSAIAYGFNSPGVAFKLSETDLGNRLEKAVMDFEDVVFIESYGNRQLMMESDPAELHLKALTKYYQNSRRIGL